MNYIAAEMVESAEMAEAAEMVEMVEAVEAVEEAEAVGEAEMEFVVAFARPAVRRAGEEARAVHPLTPELGWRLPDLLWSPVRLLHVLLFWRPNSVALRNCLHSRRSGF